MNRPRTRSAAGLLLSAVLAVAASRSSPAAETVVTVIAEGGGDFRTIQAAVDSIPDRNTNACVILVAPGRYAERVTVSRGRRFVTLRGMGRLAADVVIAGGTGRWGVVSVSADDFRAEKLTLENTAGPSAGAQMALFCDGKRQVFEDLVIKGWQDTLGSWNGNVAYFRNCEIRGSVDFIYSGGTALFDRCDIVQIRELGGPVAAPSTPKDVTYGLVFLNCRVKKLPAVAANSSTLMRPWRPDGQTAFINCVMDDHITAKGWSEWDGRENTCRAVEYGSRKPDGTAIDLSKRAPWAKILTAAEAAQYTVTNVLGGWNPAREVAKPLMRGLGGSRSGRI